MREQSGATAVVGMAGAPKFQDRSVRGLLRENVRLRRQLQLSAKAASRHALMLREGDHRIKNSLQILASLLNMQARHESQHSVQAALHGTSARVRAIACLHDAMQVAGAVETVDLSAVLREACQALQVMEGEWGAHQVNFQTEPITLPVELARPLIIAVIELIVNALRHAFPDGRQGKVLLSVVLGEHEVVITVADDGIGLPKGFDAGPGYGMKLINMLVDQVSGEMLVEDIDGSRFTIRTPVTFSRDD